MQKISKPEDIDEFKSENEDDIPGLYHMSIGMWMRNNWGLSGGSRLAKWFNTKGIYHPDDMSSIILLSFWRHLNQKPIELDNQIEYYKDYWEKQKSPD